MKLKYVIHKKGRSKTDLF